LHLKKGTNFVFKFIQKIYAKKVKQTNYWWEKWRDLKAGNKKAGL